jgi:NADPH:quinone reductase-like Zn-dependent oxidoreductase
VVQRPGPWQACSPEAHLVSYAYLGGLPIQVPQVDLIGKRLIIRGFWMYYEEFLPRMRAALTEATQAVASGKLSLPIAATYKPSQIKEAIEHSERGGKFLLDFDHAK